MNNLSGTQINIVFTRLGISSKLAAILQSTGIANTLAGDIEILIRNFLGGHITPEEFASGLRLLNIDDTKLKQFIELFKKDIFVPVYTEVEIVKKEQAEIEAGYNTPIEEEPEDIMHNAGIDIDEQPEEIETVQSNDDEIVANINKREMKTFSNAGISFENSSSQNALLMQSQYINQSQNEQKIDEAKLIEGIEHPTKSEAVVFKGVAQTKMNQSFSIPSTKTDQSLPRVDTFATRNSDPYRNQIDEQV